MSNMNKFHGANVKLTAEVSGSVAALSEASQFPESTYGNGEFLQWLLERDITPHMRTRDSVHGKNSPVLWPRTFKPTSPKATAIVVP